MFPNLEPRRTKNNVGDDWSRLTAENTAKMVDILATLVKSNDELNKKTDKLLQLTEKLATATNSISDNTEETKKNTHNNTRLMRRVEKKLDFLHANFDLHQVKRLQATGTLINKQRISNSIKNSQSLDRGSRSHINFPLLSGSGNRKMDVLKTDQQQPQSALDNRTNMSANNIDEIKQEFILLQQKIGYLSAEITTLNDGLAKTCLITEFREIRDLFLSQNIIEFEDLKLKISGWIGIMYRSITDYTYAKYSTKVFSQQQTRLFFCQSLIINSLNIMNFMRKQQPAFWIKHRFELLQHIMECERNILKFLKTKFPRNKKTFKSIEFEKLIQKINNSEDPRYDIIKNTEIEFKLKTEEAHDKSDRKGTQLIHEDDIHYIKEIKLLFNRLIQEVEKEYVEFHQNMVFIFTGGDHTKEGKGKYLIGKKFKDNIPLFTQQELQSFDFKCKSPEILRIIIKWLEEIEEIITKPEQVILSKKAFKNYKLNNKDAVPASEKIRRDIIEQVKTKVKSSKQKVNSMVEILSNLIDNISELVESKTNNTQFLQPEDVKTIKFSELIRQSIPFFALDKIQTLIKIFRSLQTDFRTKLIQQIDLLTFSVFDLLRCRCTGSKDEIAKIYQRTRQSKYFEIIRVKNRLDTPLNDILINCKLTKSPLICEIQLSITNQYFDEKSLINDHFNHFLYELQRARFGPLCEASLMISDKDPRMQYAPELRKVKMTIDTLTNQQKQAIKLNETHKMCYNRHDLATLDHSLPFICTLCSTYNKEYTSCFDAYQCFECNLRICPSCYFAKFTDEEKSNMYFKQDLAKSRFYKPKYYELRSYKTKRKGLEGIVKEILEMENAKYCILIRFSQGIITQKGFKLLSNKILCPVFFYIKNEINIDRDYEKYDVILIPNNTNFEIKTIKDIKSYKAIQLSQSGLPRQIIETKAIELKKNFITIVDNDRVLIMDYHEEERDEIYINQVLKNNKIKAIINQCSITKNTTLDISSRELTEITLVNYETETLKHILTIVADDNQIKDATPLLKLPKVRKISMKNNEVSCFNITNISDNIVDLFFAYNHFTEFPLLVAKGLTRIIFKKNKLVGIANLEQSQFPSLVELGLGQNFITDFPKINMPKLEKLTLKTNKLKTIQKITQSVLPELTGLDCEENQIEEIPVLNQPRLQKITLKKNKITSVKTLLSSKLPKLNSLNLSNNKIQQFIQIKLQNLTYLDLSGNRISDLSFLNSDNFLKLKELSLKKNKIEVLPKINCENLVRLDVSENLIKRLCDLDDSDNYFLYSNIPSLEYLNIIKGNCFDFYGLIICEISRKLKQIRKIH